MVANYGPGGQQQYGAGRPPAPGASPKGGTTSLPQALQSPSAMPGQAVGGGIGGTTPGGSGGAMGAPPAAAPPVPASTPPGAVPPAPPPSGPAASTSPPAAGAADPQKQMGDALFHKLMEMISNPSRYGEATDSARAQSMQKLSDERQKSTDHMNADMAGRGLFNSSRASTSLGDIESQFLRGQGDMEAGLVKDEAAHRNEDLQTTLNAIFGYGDRQRMDSHEQNDLLMQLINGGYLKGSDANALIGQLSPKAG